MRRRIAGIIAAVALIGGLLGAPEAVAGGAGGAGVPDGGAPDGEVTVTYIVPTRHADIYLEVVHPTKGGDILKAPMILTYSPYSVLGRNGDSAEFVPRGYARAYADVVGTGNSGGCYDYGGLREKETGFDIVEWVAKQKWSTGKIAMYGGSYDGTTANATAVMRPPHLTTIVPEAAISRWYGYAFSGGIRYSYNNEWIGHESATALDDEGFDTPLAFDFGLAIPPPLDPQDPKWAERVQSAITPCDEITHTEHGYDDTPDYDDFWLERDYVKDAGKVKIPVLVASNWGDWNVKQEESWNWYNALKNSSKRVLYMGSRWDDHGSPVHGDADKDKYFATVKKWFDHYLMGKNNGIQNMPAVVSQTADQAGRGKWFEGAPKVRNVTLYAQLVPITDPTGYQWMLLPTKPRKCVPTFVECPDDRAAFPSTNINTESHALHHGRSNHDWQWFEAPVFRKDVRIFGSPKVQVYSTIGREWITITPTIADVNPADHVFVGTTHAANSNPNSIVGVTRGWLDSRYRNGLDKQVMVTPGKPFESTVTMKPLDYTFTMGHYIGLNLQTEINEWSIPKPYLGCDEVPEPDPNDPQGSLTKNSNCAVFFVNWDEARTRVILPVVNPPKNRLNMFCFRLEGCHDHG
jgi:X-Pro dipeptidyl-peptidase